jgi:hypothetical protein
LRASSRFHAGALATMRRQERGKARGKSPPATPLSTPPALLPWPASSLAFPSTAQHSLLHHRHPHPSLPTTLRLLYKPFASFLQLLPTRSAYSKQAQRSRVPAYLDHPHRREGEHSDRGIARWVGGICATITRASVLASIPTAERHARSHRHCYQAAQT